MFGRKVFFILLTLNLFSLAQEQSDSCNYIDIAMFSSIRSFLDGINRLPGDYTKGLPSGVKTPQQKININYFIPAIQKFDSQVINNFRIILRNADKTIAGTQAIANLKNNLIKKLRSDILKDDYAIISLFNCFGKDDPKSTIRKNLFISITSQRLLEVILKLQKLSNEGNWDLISDDYNDKERKSFIRDYFFANFTELGLNYPVLQDVLEREIVKYINYLRNKQAISNDITNIEERFLNEVIISGQPNLDFLKDLKNLFIKISYRLESRQSIILGMMFLEALNSFEPEPFVVADINLLKDFIETPGFNILLFDFIENLNLENFAITRRLNPEAQGFFNELRVALELKQFGANINSFESVLYSNNKLDRSEYDFSLLNNLIVELKTTNYDLLPDDARSRQLTQIEKEFDIAQQNKNNYYYCYLRPKQECIKINSINSVQGIQHELPITLEELAVESMIPAIAS